MPDWGPLGDVLGRSPAQNVANVERATGEAAALLKAVRDTFPAYTLHDEQHALNVVRLMGELARPRIENLEPLEAALLILSAYFHDIGMVYSEADRAKIRHEEEFREFLDRDAEAFLAVRQNGDEPTPAVLEKYCRLRHADRVRVHLDRLDQREPALLRWDGISLVSILGKLCASHNQPTADIVATFDRFLTVADTRFCAMLLRLADIMDFDRTRTPRAIHEYLGLGEAESEDLAESERHWQQHLVGGGFSFPPGERADRYPVDYAANPTNPGVEHDIRCSLAEVSAEFERCRRVRDDCRRWRDLPLPGDIDTSGIDSIGYTYGDFHFALDRSAVLELFTGEELYEDPYAFLRELLQNAIDAVQTRLAVHGELPDNPPGVDVTCWEDRDGFLWVRVDDSGTGMDERLIREYFLRVGRSYYNSAEFRADLLRDGQPPAFTPISRFGIGVLSCFMAGDRVEVSTRHLPGHRHGPGAATPLRLSLHRDRDYFVLRTKGQGPDDMPVERGTEGFRTRTGTGIAVRIDPDRTGFELQTLIDKVHEYVFAPPVPVTVNTLPASAFPPGHVERLWLDAPAVVHLRTADSASRDDAFPYLAGLRVVALPLDLDRTTSVTSVSGRLLAFAGLPPEDVDPGRDLLAGWPAGPAAGVDLSDVLHQVDYDLSWENETVLSTGTAQKVPVLFASIWRYFDVARLQAVMKSIGSPVSPPAMFAAGTETDRAEEILASAGAMRTALQQMLAEGTPERTVFVYECRDLGLEHLDELLRAHWDRLGWAHSGIVLPSSVLVPSGGDSQPTWLGVICLQGPLRPDVTVSRDAVRAVPLAVHSAVQLAVRLAAAGLDAPHEAREQVMASRLIPTAPAERYAVATFAAEPLISGGKWNEEAVIAAEGRAMSVAEIQAATGAGDRILLQIGGPGTWESDAGMRFDFYEHLPVSLLHLFCSVAFERVDDKGGVLCAVAPAETVPLSSLLPPLYAVRFLDPQGVARAPRTPFGGWLNVSHPLTRWVTDHAEALARQFAAPFNRVLRRAPWVEDPEDVNRALDRVRKARTDIPPPPAAAYVREDENGWWVSR